MASKIVLVAEDNPDDFFLFRRALDKAKFDSPVQRVEDGEEAIAYLAGQGVYDDRGKFPIPSLLLLDLKMPRRSGFEVLEWTRQHPIYKRLPVVVLTSSSQPEDVDRAYSLGANSYLVKPGDFNDLIKLSHAIDDYWMTSNQPPVL
jgi:CheY-like chemotaxis protein